MLMLVMIAVAAWLGLAVALAGFMARRGYDHTSWLVVAVLFGPVSVVFVVVELAWAVPRPAQVVRRGHAGRGDLDVLVVVDAAADLVPTAAISALNGRIHRLAVAGVVPFDGARDVERLAAEQLSADADALRHADAELVLLFGTPEDAVARYLAHHHVDAVIADALAGPSLGRAVPATTAHDLDGRHRTVHDGDPWRTILLGAPPSHA